MKLFHYTTWNGERINESRVIQPSKRYSSWVPQSLIDEWPNLTFLTSNPEWEPSIQALSFEEYWEKCGSYPETYAALGIPCWRFEINPNGLVLGMVSDFRGCNKWQEMLDDAMLMGSNLDDWRVVVQDAIVINAWKWCDDEWNLSD